MNSFPATSLGTFNVFKFFFWNVFYMHAMHNLHILQRIMQCVGLYVYIVICNTVRLIVGKVIVTALFGSSVHTSRY